MKILLTGATGYIGKQLLPFLLEKGHEVVCCVRDRSKFDVSEYASEKVSVIEADFLEIDSLNAIPSQIDVAYYLIHSMASTTGQFENLEKKSAENFLQRISKTSVKQVIYLSGIVNSQKLSKHLESRKNVEDILKKGSYHLTTLRAGIVVGAGSGSFEIIRDLVEKLPIMVAPKWLKTLSQPIAVQNVLEYLMGVIMNQDAFDKDFDIGGPEILTYKQMLLEYARVRRLKRWVWIVPVMTPKLSSYWLYFITSTSYNLAVNLVHSMKVDVICRPNNLAKELGINLLPYDVAVAEVFKHTAEEILLPKPLDSESTKTQTQESTKIVEIPEHGCYVDIQRGKTSDANAAWQKIIQIGGKNGWYFANWLWEVRGFLDKIVGGVGLRRGRQNQFTIQKGEILDFWRVVDVNPDRKRLLLFAEMKLPGDAWLEFKIIDNELIQTATFRPLGLWGRFYWFAIYPVHVLIFKGMARKVAKG
jgi:uncharacterized protein YbjT (DUF2867 family)